MAARKEAAPARAARADLVARCGAMRARSERRKIANEVSRQIRLGRFNDQFGAVCELVGHEHRCSRCGFKGRVFWIQQFVPQGDDPIPRFVRTPELEPAQRSRLGAIVRSPLWCAVCLLDGLGRWRAR